MVYIREHKATPPPPPRVKILDRLSFMGGFAYKRQLHIEFSGNHDWKNIPSAISFTLAFSGQTVSPEVNKVSSSTHSADLWKKKKKETWKSQTSKSVFRRTPEGQINVSIMEKLIFFEVWAVSFLGKKGKKRDWKPEITYRTWLLHHLHLHPSCLLQNLMRTPLSSVSIDRGVPVL